MLRSKGVAAVQKRVEIEDFVAVDATAPVATETHGERAKCLQRLIRLDLPVPASIALSFATVRSLASGGTVDAAKVLAHFGEAPLVSVRPSSGDPEWGGPEAILNIGMNDARHAEYASLLGPEAADRLYSRFVQTYSVQVAHLDPDAFEAAREADAGALRSMLDAYEAEMDEPFPQNPERQLTDVLKSMARAWEGTSARLLRQARGAPPDAGLGLVVQAMAAGVGPPESGSGAIQFVSGDTGEAEIVGRYLSQSQGRDALRSSDAMHLARGSQGASLEDLCPEAFAELVGFGATCRDGLRELADAMNLPLSKVTRHVEALEEFNPMLGLRGVRLGVTIPEIYEAQAEAIFLATIHASRPERQVVPEIMIPLVSASREVELVRSRIEAVAAAVRTRMGASRAQGR